MASRRDVRADAERQRLEADASRRRNWERWGPYLAERQWATVREDYSADGNVWNAFPHDHARSRAYRWGEDGLLGITDRECRLCFAVALWNGKDAILKERLFGLTNPEGNHGEDVKEIYFFLDSTPTHSYMKAMYRYPLERFPYEQLVEENRNRTRKQPEFELLDTGIFDHGFIDCTAEYAKADTDDVLIRLTLTNHADRAAELHVLPTLWFRNTWIWGCRHEGCTLKPRIEQADADTLLTDHETLGQFRLEFAPGPDGVIPRVLFTENETNTQRLFGVETYTKYVKDVFHEFIVNGRNGVLKPDGVGTKAAPHYTLNIPAGQSVELRLRLSEASLPAMDLGDDKFARVFDDRIAEADAFYDTVIPRHLSDDARRVARQAYAGLLWSKQFYHYVVDDWLTGDPAMPPPPPQRLHGRNSDWRHVYSRDVLSMPDTWEYPWFAAWDLAFHMLPMAQVDANQAKRQLMLMMREWYMHPNGQLPAYEFAFGDVNPPVHAWACWRVYKMTGPRGQRDITFLGSAFQKLLLNFTWWVNRKDESGRHIFSGGFLGLDNIGVFDRSNPPPWGGQLDQADGTAWMAFYCTTMLAMALELATHDRAYEDMASKFFEHFVAIVDAMNSLGGAGLWDEADGFYYDQLHIDSQTVKLKIRSIVGLIPLFACEVLEHDVIEKLPGFKKRMMWFLKHRPDLARYVSYVEEKTGNGGEDVDPRRRYLLAVPSRQRLESVLRYMLDPKEFLSPFGVRSLSKVHQASPYVLRLRGVDHTVAYQPGESETDAFGGNSNWRGPIWFPINYLIVETLQRYHYFFGESFRIECPTGSGHMLTLKQVAEEIAVRLCSLFLPGKDGRRPCFGSDRRFADDPRWKDLLLFHEYFHGETGRGLGAEHQTGWTALVVRCFEELAKSEMHTADGKHKRTPRSKGAPAS
jgi:hypothetical protein